MAPGRDWPKVVTVVEAGMARGLPNWNMEPMAGVKAETRVRWSPKEGKLGGSGGASHTAHGHIAHTKADGRIQSLVCGIAGCEYGSHC